jgi:asparagine synthetase B (glutamine-hydrolysing)
VLQEGLDALAEVIYHVETYDVTTIRASTPMFLMTRKIKALGVKMVLSGEGSDEIFGGYLYFHKAPNKEELHRETVRKVFIYITHALKCFVTFGCEISMYNFVPRVKFCPQFCFLGPFHPLKRFASPVRASYTYGSF